MSPQFQVILLEKEMFGKGEEEDNLKRTEGQSMYGPVIVLFPVLCRMICNHDSVCSSAAKPRANLNGLIQFIADKCPRFPFFADDLCTWTTQQDVGGGIVRIQQVWTMSGHHSLYAKFLR